MTQPRIFLSTNFTELKMPTVLVAALNLRISSTGSHSYVITSCTQSDSGTFNLGSKLMRNEKGAFILYEINHVDSVQLLEESKCRQSAERFPS